MKIIFATGAAPAATPAAVIRFVTRDQRAKLAPPVAEEEFSGKANALLYSRHDATLCVGLGERAKINAHTLRSAAGAAAMFLKKIGRTRAVVRLEDWPKFAAAVVEGLILGDYRFERFKTKRTPALENVAIHVLAEDLVKARSAGRRGETIAEAANLARDVANQPGNLLYPESLAARAVKLGRDCKLQVTVFDEKKLRAGKFGGLIAVGQGSERGPRMIVIEHRGGPKSEKPVALVGKAITFDTGGISIKPAANMEDMIFDKCGGLAVLGAMAAIAKLNVRRNVVGIIASAENMPGGGAYRPGDIITTYDGKHVEIVNTDAEGRMVLADAIAYARLDCKAAAIIDLATLTGACGIALGDTAAGFWHNDEAFGKRVLAAAEKAGERLWPMPLYAEFEDQIRSDVALIKNSGGRPGGACTAAAFLKTFAEDTPWAHLDIASMAQHGKDRADLARGATGFGVRTLVELVAGW